MYSLEYLIGIRKTGQPIALMQLKSLEEIIWIGNLLINSMLIYEWWIKIFNWYYILILASHFIFACLFIIEIYNNKYISNISTKIFNRIINTKDDNDIPNETSQKRKIRTISKLKS
jgi:hypothetical protein